ncbi:MAG TPA: ABC transporter substrate-binding protein [Chloroflexota bacterium]|nr:ABC transporter substrate-binding protein [Chloroflexota bacterium]
MPVRPFTAVLPSALLAISLVACGSSAAPASSSPAAAAGKPAASTAPADAASAGAKPATGASASAKPAAAASGSAAAKPGNLTKLEFGATALTAFNWPEYVAENKGFWKDQGLDVQRTIFQTDSQNIQALVSGSVNVSQATIDVIIRADSTAKNNDIKMVAGNVSDPPYAIVTKPDISTWKDLAGKQVAVTDLTGGSTVLLKKALAANGVDPKSVTMISSGGTSNRLAALKSGAVSFTILAQPQSYEAQDGGYKILGLTTDYVKDFQFTGYNVSEKWAGGHQQDLIGFLKGIDKGVKWLYDPANKAEAVKILSTALKSSNTSAFEKTWDLYFKDNGNIIPKNSAVNVNGTEVVIQAMADDGELKQPLPKAQDFIDSSYLQKAGIS